MNSSTYRYIYKLAGFPAGYSAIFSIGIRPDIWLFAVSRIRSDIRQVKPGIRQDTGYKKGRIIPPNIRLAGYPVHP
jgi:hypothetical protein